MGGAGQRRKGRNDAGAGHSPVVFNLFIPAAWHQSSDRQLKTTVGLAAITFLSDRQKISVDRWLKTNGAGKDSGQGVWGVRAGKRFEKKRKKKKKNQNHRSERLNMTDVHERALCGPGVWRYLGV